MPISLPVLNTMVSSRLHMPRLVEGFGSHNPHPRLCHFHNGSTCGKLQNFVVESKVSKVNNHPHCSLKPTEEEAGKNDPTPSSDLLKFLALITPRRFLRPGHRRRWSSPKMIMMKNFKTFLVFLILSLAVGFASIVFVLRWVLHFKEGLAWDGGLAEFNWHPLLIVIGFIFLQGIAIIVYRLPWTWRCSKLMMKFIHAGLNLLAFTLASVSLVAVFDFHNAQNIPNMYSLHSWVGLSAVILYALQLVLGLAVYLLPFTPGFIRAALMPVHVYGGLFIFSSVIATALMGITEKLIFGLKDPKYKDSPPEAVFVNVLGVLISVFGGLILWIATRPAWKRPSENQMQLMDNSYPVTFNPTAANGKLSVVTTSKELPDQEWGGEARRRNGKMEESEGKMGM